MAPLTNSPQAVIVHTMLLRTWHTGIDETRSEEYDRFASEHSLPMFARHAGLLGVLLLRPRSGQRAVLTVWRDAAAARALEDSDDYRRTVQAIQEAGFLRPPQRVTLIELDEADGPR